MIRRSTRPAGERSNHGDRQRGGAGDACAGRRFATRGERRVFELVVTRKQGQQRQLARSGQSDQCEALTQQSVSIERTSMRPSVRGSTWACAQADRGVQGDGAVVEQIQRPDVDGPAGQIDARRRRRGDRDRVHREIIATHTVESLASCRQTLFGAKSGSC